MMKIKNKLLFYVGMYFQVLQFGAIITLLMSFLYWNCFTYKVFIGFLVALGLVFYNILSALMISLAIERK